MSQAIEDVFTTRLADRTLNMIEDEQGDIWWGFGHREASEFTNEVNQWLISECGVTDPDDLFAASEPVEHLWARMSEKYDDRFTVCEPTGRESDAGLFPVTRLMI